jgi:putative membrane protein insertion efficiency factor
MEVKPTPPGIIAMALLLLIRLYQLTLSALIGRHCRHMPSCSAYAAEAITRHGAWAGFWLALFRASRCHPWGTHGLDPVPTSVPRLSFKLSDYRKPHPPTPT